MQTAAQAVLVWVDQGIAACMNRFNGLERIGDAQQPLRMHVPARHQQGGRRRSRRRPSNCTPSWTSIRRRSWPAGPGTNAASPIRSATQEGPVLPDLLPGGQQATWPRSSTTSSSNESILRMLILQIDPKLEETMLAVARDEHALALQAATEDAPKMRAAEGAWATIGIGDRGGRPPTPTRARLAPRFIQVYTTVVTGRTLHPGEATMANLNKVMLIGRLTRDPEMRTFANGGKVAQHRLRRQQSPEERLDRASGRTSPCFLDVEAFNRGEGGRQLADLVEGSCARATRSSSKAIWCWTSGPSQDGQKRSKLKIVMDNLQFLEPKGERRRRRRWRRAGGRSAPPARSGDYDRALRSRPPRRAQRRRRHRRGDSVLRVEDDAIMPTKSQETQCRSARAGTAACSWC